MKPYKKNSKMETYLFAMILQLNISHYFYMMFTLELK